jgi:hypothetical protein
MGQGISKTTTLLAARWSDWIDELADIITLYKYGATNYFGKLSIVSPELQVSQRDI